MLSEVVRELEPRVGARLVDATLGLGGHAEALLEAITPGGELIGLDRDPEMLERARARLERFGSAFVGVQARFSFLGDAVRGLGRDRVDGVLLDLGICSAQLDTPERGLSFRSTPDPSPLDMRLDRSTGETAAELIDRLDEDGLADVMRDGGVPAPRRIARALIAARPVRTTDALLAALEGVRLPRRRHHPATLVFQALRIAVNDELSELDAGVEAALELLDRGGRLVVLSYHSGEDRRVKAFFAREAKGCICPPELPRCGCGRVPRLALRRRGDPATESEIAANPRARSARLRSGERL
jgi:16S rRNA (cytosine1402-N4)-methyltransferase